MTGNVMTATLEMAMLEMATLETATLKMATLDLDILSLLACLSVTLADFLDKFTYLTLKNLGQNFNF